MITPRRLVETQPRAHHVPGPQADLRHAPLRHDRLHRRHREVEQRRRDQGRPAARSAAARPTTSAASASGRRSRRTSAARPPASSGIPRGSNDSALASVSMGYQVGVTPLQMVGGGQRGRQRRRPVQPRVVRAFIRDGRARRGAAQGRPADDHGRHGRDLTTIMEQVVERGTAQARRRSPATRSPARPAPPRSSSTAATRSPTTTRRSSGSCRRASPALTHPRRHRLAARQRATTAARSPAPIFKRIAEAALTLSRHRAEPQRAAAGAGGAARSVARSDRGRRSRRARRACCRRPSSPRATD